jgi:hypothetical protein
MFNIVMAKLLTLMIRMVDATGVVQQIWLATLFYIRLGFVGEDTAI